MSDGGFLERFLARVEETPDRLAIVLGVETGAARGHTYAELLALIERMRAALLAEGVGPGDRVLIVLPSSLDLIASFYAVVSLSAMAIPIAADLTEFELDPILRDARPTGVISTEAHLAGALGRRTSSVRLRLVAAHGLAYASRSALAIPAPQTLVGCHFTYKGLGYPLGATHRYGAYTRCVDGLTTRFADSRWKRHLVCLPLHPIYSLSCAVMAPLGGGCELHLVSRLDPREILAVLAERQVRFACLVPALLRALSAGLASERGARLRERLDPQLEIVTGGSHLSAELAAELHRTLGSEPLQGYGATETLPVTTNCAATARHGSLGQPLTPAHLLSIVGADGDALPSGATGEIVVSGPTVMAGYFERPVETARFLRDDGFHTGDLGMIDRDGFTHFVGRRLPFAKILAQMVDLTEVENVVRSHPAVADARATPGVDSRGGERLVMSVVVKGSASLTEGDVLAICRRHLSRHKLPRVVNLYRRSISPVEDRP